MNEQGPEATRRELERVLRSNEFATVEQLAQALPETSLSAGARPAPASEAPLTSEPQPPLPSRRAAG